MQKTDDFFFAGLIAGAIGGACLIIYNYGLLLLGLPSGSYWEAMGGLFYNKELLQSWPAQLHGVIDATGVSAMNGVLTCFVLKYTGKEYIYLKSASLSAFGAYFLFVAVYPHTGLGKDNPYTPWVALFGHTVFIGLLVGYILSKIYSFKGGPVLEAATDEEDREYSNDLITKQQLKLKVLHPPLARPQKDMKLRKPKKI